MSEVTLKKQKASREQFYSSGFKFVAFACCECGASVNVKPVSYLHYKNEFCQRCGFEHYR